MASVPDDWAVFTCRGLLIGTLPSVSVRQIIWLIGVHVRRFPTGSIALFSNGLNVKPTSLIGGYTPKYNGIRVSYY